MSGTQVLRSRFPRGAAGADRLVGAPGRFLDSVGHVAWFVVTAMGSIGHALRYYRKETLRLIAEIGMGTGAMAVIGGTSAGAIVATLLAVGYTGRDLHEVIIGPDLDFINIMDDVPVRQDFFKVQKRLIRATLLLSCHAFLMFRIDLG